MNDHPMVSCLSFLIALITVEKEKQFLKKNSAGLKDDKSGGGWVKNVLCYLRLEERSDWLLSSIKFQKSKSKLVNP